jgi:hypothetical protein
MLNDNNCFLKTGSEPLMEPATDNSRNCMRKRTTDVTIALIVFIFCCLMSFLKIGADGWQLEGWVAIP